MEFHVAVPGPGLDRQRIEDYLLQLDPAAVLDIDRRTGMLRISTCLERGPLLETLGCAGYPVPAAWIRQLPSICCGGCSG